MCLSMVNCNANVVNCNLNTEIQENKNCNLEFIDLEGTSNTRDLGNYTTSDGKITKSKVFLRSDNTNDITDSDIKKLKDEYNLKTVIDLRSNSGVNKKVDKLSNVEGIDYKHIPLMIPKSEIAKSLIRVVTKKSDVGDVYISILSQKESIKNILDTIANSQDGCILFHCTHGKDRTGIVSALILSLSGVSDKDVIENYSVTSDLLDNAKNKKILLKARIDRAFKSNSAYMEKFLNYINKTYKSTLEYLLNCGVSHENLDKIIDRFVE